MLSSNPNYTALHHQSLFQIKWPFVKRNLEPVKQFLVNLLEIRMLTFTSFGITANLFMQMPKTYLRTIFKRDQIVLHSTQSTFGRYCISQCLCRNLLHETMSSALAIVIFLCFNEPHYFLLLTWSVHTYKCSFMYFVLICPAAAVAITLYQSVCWVVDIDVNVAFIFLFYLNV